MSSPEANEDESFSSPDPVADAAREEAVKAQQKDEMNRLKDSIRRYAGLTDDEIATLFTDDAAIRSFHADMITLRGFKDQPESEKGESEPEDATTLSDQDKAHAALVEKRQGKIQKNKAKKAFKDAAAHLPPDQQASFDDAPPVNYDEFMASISGDEDSE